MTTKKRYAAVGIGGRIPMFIDPLAKQHRKHGELVGLCDLSLTRARFHHDRLKKQYGYQDVPIYHADEFDQMVKDTQPDTILVCTMDSTHHEYILKAFELGCDAVTEKPMTTDAAKCRAIVEAVKRTGKNLRVAFNYRWGPGPSKVRETIASGAIGDIKHVNLEYFLDTAHGADYFRRWHSDKSCSGGLLVHKSTHHFDLVNWWIDAIPEQVFAHGALRFYGKENAIARGDEAYTKYERYTGTSSEDDPFALSLEHGSLKHLYLEAEEESKYIRDRNVFREGIDIEDTMSVSVKYRTGVLLTYSLVAYSPIEGFRVSFSGDRGRIEYVEKHASHIITGDPNIETARIAMREAYHGKELRVYPHFGLGEDVPIEETGGAHGGGDEPLQAQIFDPNAPQDPLRRSAGHEQGAASILIGAAANESIKTGLPVTIADLCPLRPDARRLSELI